MKKSERKSNFPSFITFEGGEGAGKSTLIEKVATYLRGLGHDVVVTREPGGTPLGEEIRKWLLFPPRGGPLSSRAELFLLLAARAQHVQEVIRPAIAHGKVVLCDRYHDSTLAYQGGARGFESLKLIQWCDFAGEGLMPDLTFYLDIDPVIGLKRAKQASLEGKKEGQDDRMELENLSFHQAVRQAFLALSLKSPERIKVLDGARSSEAVFDAACKVLSVVS